MQNEAEGAIRELKRGAGRKITSLKAPQKLWDHCLELEAFILSRTALYLFKLQGQVPETILSGQTVDIFPFVECKWYEFVRWYDVKAQFPQPRENYGRWLGPSLDIGPAMTANILKENGQVLHLSTYWPLNEVKMSDAAKFAEWSEFDKNITTVINQPMTQERLILLDGDTPTYPRYHDAEEDTQYETEGKGAWWTRERSPRDHTRRIRKLHRGPG